jgi:hypothetical protein
MPTFTQRLKAAWRGFRTGSAAPAQPARRVPPAITPAEAAEARQFFPLDKFFIFGHARSGTTLLTRLARLHPQVHCNYQAHFFTRLPLLESLAGGEEIASWLSRKSNRWNQGGDLSALVLRAAADFIMERDARRVGKGAPGCVVGDKSPNSLLDGKAVEKLVNVYPDGRLVFIVRDGRDAALSHRFQTFIDRPQHLDGEGQRIRAAFIADPAPFLSGQRSLFGEKALRTAAQGWAHNVVETDAAARRLLPHAYYLLRYEDLLADPAGQMLALWAFLGVDASLPMLRGLVQAEMAQNPDADWQAQKAGEIASALEKGKRGNWQQIFTPADRQIFLEAAGETLRRWNYAER